MDFNAIEAFANYATPGIRATVPAQTIAEIFRGKIFEVGGRNPHTRIYLNGFRGGKVYFRVIGEFWEIVTEQAKDSGYAPGALEDEAQAAIHGCAWNWIGEHRAAVMEEELVAQGFTKEDAKKQVMLDQLYIEWKNDTAAGKYELAAADVKAAKNLVEGTRYKFDTSKYEAEFIQAVFGVAVSPVETVREPATPTSRPQKIDFAKIARSFPLPHWSDDPQIACSDYAYYGGLGFHITPVEPAIFPTSPEPF